jgi:hypothetical protein
VNQNYTTRFRLWLAQIIVGRTPLVDVLRRAEREQCVDLIKKLAARWGQADRDVIQALLAELDG